VLLASVLAIGAQLAGCGPTDCPATVAASTSCGTEGMTCYDGPDQCTCTGGIWQCGARDMAVPDLAPRHDLASHD
jgi:hypothetical protein